MAECLEDSYCSSTIIFPHTRPHISTNLISRFLLSTLAAEAWRSNAGSAKFRGPVVWFILNTVVVVHLKTLVWFTLNTGDVVHLKHRVWFHLKHQGCGTP